jgi:hypothetical protein
MDDLLIRVLTRLLRVHEEMGEKAFEDAAHRALVAIALAVQIEASRKLGIHGPALDEQIVPFPLDRRRPSGRLQGDDVA